MKINKDALKESITDTTLGAIVNFPLSWLTITIVLHFTHNSFIISLSQLIVLSILAIIRRYYTRVYFDKRNKRNGFESIAKHFGFDMLGMDQAAYMYVCT